MGNIVDINSRRELAHYASHAKCLACNHKWEAVSPAGVIDLECPSCGATRGVATQCLVPDDICYVCGCGNSCFSITPQGAFCLGCGITHCWDDFIDG